MKDSMSEKLGSGRESLHYAHIASPKPRCVVRMLINNEMKTSRKIFPTPTHDYMVAHLSEGVSFSAYCNVDDDLTTAELMSDDDILEFVTEPKSVNGEDVEDTEDDPQQPLEVTSSMVRNTLGAMNNILAATENVPAEMFGIYYALEQFLQQKY
ncbi:conserved hypothetical protein [Culex quinquefasciatus]|uniref:Uncharacterized protein n=1 Tax=Culex quinquefasciatus TaxID=7176 RepID=B0XBG1_CULQU|nr:conserved hypothetical protein [Culex quinquefasciatus]|eukprot:XP_001866983.1 conserved hypothetical protein [Culex quinquefasciatus]